MATLRIFVFGSLGVTALVTITTIHVRHERTKEQEDLKTLREITPERLITNCGQPSSDTESIVLDAKAGVVAVDVAGVSTESSDKRVALARLIEYKQPQSHDWVKLEFVRDVDNQLRPTQWQLTHFASPSVGVNPSDQNAYIAIPVFPCMAKTAPSHP